MAKRPSKKEDLSLIRAALQEDMANGATPDQAFAKVWEAHAEAANRVIKESPMPKGPNG